MDHTKIEWTDASWNPIRGCSRVSAGCEHCYAERVAARFDGPGQPYEGLIHSKTRGWNGAIMLLPELLGQPLRWSRPRKIFVNSTSDLFHERVPDEFIDRVFAIMASASRHTFQILTKRPERALAYLRRVEAGAAKAVHDYLNSPDYKASEAACEAIGWKADIDPPTGELRFIYDHADANDFLNEGRHRSLYGEYHWRGWPLSNVWLGVSVEDQAAADERIPLLLQMPAAVRFLSCEPLLGPIDLRRACALRRWKDSDGVECCGVPRNLDWVIVGGESGPQARPMDPRWARSLRDQCNAADVPFFFKQWGEWATAEQSALGHDEPIFARIVRRASIHGTRGLAHAFADPTGDMAARLGKKKAGRKLDGREHNAWPHKVIAND